jgi:hypothetical protein
MAVVNFPLFDCLFNSAILMSSLVLTLPVFGDEASLLKTIALQQAMLVKLENQIRVDRETVLALKNEFAKINKTPEGQVRAQTAVRAEYADAAGNARAADSANTAATCGQADISTRASKIDTVDGKNGITVRWDGSRLHFRIDGQEIKSL